MACAGAELPAHDKLTKQALAKLGNQMGVSFSIPFPKNFDIDIHMKQPLALLPVDGRKISATQPRLNPYDGAGTIEWMFGTDDPEKLSEDNITCMLHLDEDGKCLQIALMRHPDSWTSEGREGHQLRRREGETGYEFVTRAMLTFRLRSQKAKNPALAMRYLAAFEKMVTAIQVLRSAERTP